MRLFRLFGSVMLAACALGSFAQDPARMAWQPGQRPLHVWVSTGDNYWVTDWPAIDSPETIRLQFERLARTFRVSRVYWRGEALRIRTDDFLLRRENPVFYDYWTSVKRLVDQIKVNEMAVAEARRQKMEIWMSEGIFDHGAPGDVGGSQVFPYHAQDNLTIKNPQWLSVDRWGKRAGSGVICLSYPEARKAVIARYMALIDRVGYDGLLVYTYSENYGSTYPEEYGFSEPIVAEFRRRHGVDIRSQPFDKEAWYRLRGEYVTQFLRELGTELRKRGKKLGVGLYPVQPEKTVPWPLGSKNPRAEEAMMDWRRWVDEKIVDEIGSWYGGDPHPFVNRTLVPMARPKGVEVRIFAGSPFSDYNKDLVVDLNVVPTAALMPGGGVDRFSLQAGDLRSQDWLRRAQALQDVSAGRSRATSDQIRPLLKDANPLVRREALFALRQIGATDARAEVEQALADSELSVRVAALDTLLKIGNRASAESALAALRADAFFQQKESTLRLVRAHAPESVLISASSSPVLPVREVAVRALEDHKTEPSTEALTRAARNDQHYRVRHLAVRSLHFRRMGDTVPTLLSRLDDPEPGVQLAAVTALSGIWGGFSAPQLQQTLDGFDKLFRSYGRGSTRSDRAWGWRVVGQALARIEPRGKAILHGHLAGSDPTLAWHAFQSLYWPINPQIETVRTEAEAIRVHREHAPR